MKQTLAEFISDYQWNNDDAIADLCRNILAYGITSDTPGGLKTQLETVGGDTDTFNQLIALYEQNRHDTASNN